MATFHSSNVTAAMRQDIAASVPSLHTTTRSLSVKSICSLAAASRMAQVIPQNTSLQRTSRCTLHKLKLGLHLHRDRQHRFNPWGTDQNFFFHSYSLAEKYCFFCFLFLISSFCSLSLNQLCLDVTMAAICASSFACLDFVSVWTQRESTSSVRYIYKYMCFETF